ncbi:MULTISPECIES: hypothetical protein [Klebsiella]|uniref:hypothetical protein n=1 Tax=Klebsiella TaxID=570 RepID=UPI001899A866|nr:MULTISPECIES: hypothetical protein [Klebsiella]MCW9588292.1 hypothetical protein [Klebsiella pasteurii]
MDNSRASSGGIDCPRHAPLISVVVSAAGDGLPTHDTTFCLQAADSIDGASDLHYCREKQERRGIGRRPGTVEWMSKTTTCAPLSIRLHDKPHNL